MMNISDQSPGLFRTQIFDEIRMKTVGKILGLSNIDNLIFFIVHPVDTGKLGHSLQKSGGIKPPLCILLILDLAIHRRVYI